MYAMIRHYKFDPKDAPRINKAVAEKFAPKVSKLPGFVRWDWIDCGNGEGASLSLFLDKAGAERSLALAADFTANHLGDIKIGRPEVIAGTVVAQA